MCHQIKSCRNVTNSHMPAIAINSASSCQIMFFSRIVYIESFLLIFKKSTKNKSKTNFNLKIFYNQLIKVFSKLNNSHYYIIVVYFLPSRVLKVSHSLSTYSTAKTQYQVFFYSHMFINQMPYPIRKSRSSHNNKRAKTSISNMR